MEKNKQNEIVISGISGKFPNADNVTQFEENLYAKVDMVDELETRWCHTNPNLPKRMGKMNRIEKFDANFFGVHARQANCMDPQGRMLLECAYEAILDAGMNPKSLRNERIGVYVGVITSDAEKALVYGSPTELGMTGCTRSMLANRVSNALGFCGPSLVVDTACSSSLYALDLALTALKREDCSAAIVAGSNLLLHPNVSLQFMKLGATSIDGFVRSFDENASGYVRSEAVCAIFIQRIKDAKRVYCKVVHTKVNSDGFKDEGLTHPSSKMQAKLMTEFYNEINVDPREINYLEAHMTGTKVGDPTECLAIDGAMCNSRNEPLLVGSVKSNIGHTEAASGISSIAKVILTFVNNSIPPNIHFREPNSRIPSLVEGRLKVVTEPTPLPGPLVAINSFGLGGANAHALLEGFQKRKNEPNGVDSVKPNIEYTEAVTRTSSIASSIFCFVSNLVSKNLKESVHGINSSGLKEMNSNVHLQDLQSQKTDQPECKLPRLVVWSGRTQSACQTIFEAVTAKPLDTEFIALLNNTQTETNPANICRGYGIFLNEDAANAKCGTTEIVQGSKRPLVWVFGGMGSSWTEMGASLMQMSSFKDSLEGLHRVLEPFKINLIKIITSQDEQFLNILHSFVSITAIQIAIVDALRLVGLEPDHMIGHSMGEIACGYADGTLTSEQAILCAYWRGKVSIDSSNIRGAMAFVGFSYQTIQAIIPDDVEVACHNSPDSCTVSGPAESVELFVANLELQKKFARKVYVQNIAYHSSYIAPMGSELLRHLKHVIPEPKQRSQRWLSTSVPQSMWHLPEHQLMSAEYQVGNFLSPVLFEETSVLLPKDALTVEIGPHALMQSVLRSNIPEAVYSKLSDKSSFNNVETFLAGLGKIFAHGHDVDVNRLYPPCAFPVTINTPMIAPLIRWDHSEDWFVPNYDDSMGNNKAERVYKVELSDPEHAYLQDHMVNGKAIFPGAYYLVMVWETLGMILNQDYRSLNVEFNDIKFHRMTTCILEAEITFSIKILQTSGQFEISESSSLVASGTIKALENFEFTCEPSQRTPSNEIVLDHKSFYYDLGILGLQYGPKFRGVDEFCADRSRAKIISASNFVIFLDCMFQTNFSGHLSRAPAIIKGIERLKINPRLHLQMIEKNEVLPATGIKALRMLIAGGIEVQGVEISTVPRQKLQDPLILEKYTFVPNFGASIWSQTDAIRIIIQLMYENSQAIKVKIVELETDKAPIIHDFCSSYETTFLVVADFVLLTEREDLTLAGISCEKGSIESQTNCNLVIASNLLKNSSQMNVAIKSLKDHGYLLSRDSNQFDRSSPFLHKNAKIICSLTTNQNETFHLVQVRKSQKVITQRIIKICSEDKEYKWLEEVQEADPSDNLLFVAQERCSGLMGFMTCIRLERAGSNIRGFFIDDVAAAPFDVHLPFYKNQSDIGMAMNVYKEDQWGTYRHLLLQEHNDMQLEKRQCILKVQTTGDFSSICWQECKLVGNKDKLVQIQYASLNFRDVMIASGKMVEVSKELGFGFEYSGIVASSGKRVMGMVKGNALASHIYTTDDQFFWEVPSQWSLEEAATVPIVYSTVYMCFFLGSQIQAGKKILIHSGAGGVGLAAIRVALAYGLEVFTTVSTKAKQDYLLDLYPQLEPSHIGNSRDLSFYKMVMYATNGEGVDYVLNSLAEEKLVASIRCLRIGGSFMEIGRFDVLNGSKIGLDNFINDISFHSYGGGIIMRADLQQRQKLHDLVAKDIEAGIVVPLKTNVFAANEAEKAFRFLASGKHIGKVMLQMRETETREETLPIKIYPAFYCNSNFSYIIVGGLGGFGMELAERLVERGCTKLILSSSRGISNSYQEVRIKLLRSLGVQIVVSVADITTLEGCTALIHEAIELGTVGGIFNLALQLRDMNLEDLKTEDFRICDAVKSIATQHLDQVSRQFCPHLKQFVVFSSFVAGRGNEQQTNYGMANSRMERIIEMRHEIGIPAKAIQWGAIGDVGALTRLDKSALNFSGLSDQPISSCLDELDQLFFDSSPVVACCMLKRKETVVASSEGLIEIVMRIMGLRDINSISMDSKLSELGMDSIIGIEIKQRLEMNFDLILTTNEVRSLTFGKLQAVQDGQGVQKRINGRIEPAPNANLLRDFGNESLLEKRVLHIRKVHTKNASGVILLVPGAAGVLDTYLYEFADSIQKPLSVLQYAGTGKLTSIAEIVENLYPDVTAVFESMFHFCIIGWSYGSVLAVEFARRLETMKGLQGRLVLIDGSPKFIQRLLDALINGTKDRSVEEAVIRNLLGIYFPDQVERLWAQVSGVRGWDAQLDKAIELIGSSSPYTSAYIRTIINSMLQRVKIIYELPKEDVPVDPIKSDILLIRTSERSLADIEEDYELSSCTNGKVLVKFVDGNHSNVIENPEVTVLINEFFSDSQHFNHSSG